MTQIRFDPTFERQGKSLSQWLLDLVGDDRATRLAAGNALGGMWRGLPSYDSDWSNLDVSAGIPDFQVQQDRFYAAVRDAVDAPAFPKAVFVRKLLLFRMSLKRDWLKRTQRMSHHDEDYDRRENELLEKSITAEDEAERLRATKRFTRLFCASMARDTRITNEHEGNQAPGMARYLVTQALITQLLDAPDLLDEMLRESSLRHEALESIARMGTAGRRFAEKLLDDLEKSTDTRFDAAASLASIGAGDPQTIDRLIALVRSDREPQRLGALHTLELIGPNLAGREAECIDLLLACFDRPELRFVVTSALASVGRFDERALEAVLDQAKARPPRMKSVPDFPSYQYDEAMNGRGPALEGLKFFTQYPERAVAALTDALTSFEEYDSDWCYDRGDHGRVVASLRAFGADAAPAVPALVGLLRKKDKGVDYEVIRLLGEIGPPAQPALRALKELLAEFPPDGTEAPTDAQSPPDKAGDPLAWAIWRIESDRI